MGDNGALAIFSLATFSLATLWHRQPSLPLRADFAYGRKIINTSRSSCGARIAHYLRAYAAEDRGATSRSRLREAVQVRWKSIPIRTRPSLAAVFWDAMLSAEVL